MVQKPRPQVLLHTDMKGTHLPQVKKTKVPHLGFTEAGSFPQGPAVVLAQSSRGIAEECTSYHAK